ncbi:MAG: nucleotidyltransferase substrate binding protein [Chloroflexi bacterium]|nr:nucleotidyltransferase substrate binding protein [Chloroflexota bacterium]
MERVIERLRVARRALSTLQELTTKPELSVVERDAAIQRFEYTFEATWKAAQMFLIVIEGITANSPKSAVRACWQAGLLNEENAQRALQMCETRNMTVHTYNETLALSVYRQISGYADLLDLWLKAMEKKV